MRKGGVCERALKPPSVGEGDAMNKPMITGCQLDSGNPPVRDERGACGNVTVMGVGLRATGKPVERPPNPKMVRAPYFYPTRVYALNLNRSPENILILGVGRSPGNRRRPHMRRVMDER